ncbi:MAG: nucleoside 2-deoxyribosyltransferase [Nitrincola lacisaponensis]|uniref:Nucleoside 2-deoxyribosyltransferase n=1 Tax=Nitrincola lacisaponensis TaxID=267850 RepID=A0A063Y4M8_9GAMM|nr:nucleoside 2-deoxyribosyltransferase [Nitrincola lacisaponensis]KDE40629.1 Nucleoside 2-deoxyribosyltransferase [Nitrincola lacisaponensis]
MLQPLFVSSMAADLLVQAEQQPLSALPVSVYLAGPSVFYADVMAISAQLKADCEQLGMTPLYPLDNEIQSDHLTAAEIAQAIAQANIRMIQQADAIIADISCFRGTAMDVGTAFEIGMAVQRGIPVVSYTDAPRPDYLSRVRAADAAVIEQDGIWRDATGMIENFGLQENLMVACTTAYTDQGAKMALAMARVMLSGQLPKAV